MTRTPHPLLVCLLWILAWCTPARAEVVEVTFRTAPNGVEVYQERAGSMGRQPDFLGTSDHPVPVDTSNLTESSDLRFVLRLEGYRNLAIQVPGRYFNSTHREWPADGTVLQLQPTEASKNRQTLVVLMGSLAAVATLIGVALTAVRRHRRRLDQAIARAEALTAYEEMAAQSPDESLLMAEVGGFKLVQLLGRGGMASVYRALPLRSLDDRQAVAVKVIDRTLWREDEEFRRRFEREIDLSRRLNHPNLVRILDWGDMQGRPFIVMELVRGKTLRHYLTGQGLALEDVTRVMLDAMDGVEHAHGQGILHRDLKPDNIMITEDGLVKVMDFGLARTGQSSDKITRTGTALGTPAYMSPEQIQAKPLDPRADQYALGVVAYELYTGHLPFQADEPLQLLFKHVGEPPIPPRQFRADLPAELEALLLKMLEKQPQDRYPSLVEAAAALKAALPLPQD